METGTTPHSTEKQYPCSQCGANLAFVPGANSLKCPFCGCENVIAPATTKIEELDYRAYLKRAANEKDTNEAHRVKCEKCGAETTMPPNVTSGLCPFCGANMVFEGKSSHLIRPEGLLPFKITQKQAFEDFRRWINSLWFAPGDLKQYAQSEGKLVGIYIPCWTYDSDTISEYTGARGDHYYITETYTTTENGQQVTRTREVQHTNWSTVSGEVSNSFDDILIVASRSLPKQYADRLQPWDLQNLVPYVDEYLSGFRAESYQVSLEQGFNEATEVMGEENNSTVRQAIGGDEQRIDSIDTQFTNITFKHILLPVWLSAYRFRDHIYRILINARSGEVQGERPYSAWKIAGAIIAALILILLILFIANQNH